MAKKDPLPPGTARIDGSDGSIAFDGQYVTIRHKWHTSVGRGESRFPLGAISGVEVKNGMILATVTLVVPGAAPRTGKGDPLTVGGFQKAEAARFRDLLVTARASVDAVPLPPLAPLVAQAPDAPGFVEQLQQLAALHAQGMLTAEEFGIAKAKLLGTYASDDDPPQPW